MEDFEKCVIDRIGWARSNAEKAVLEHREIAFHMAVGQLMAFCGLAERFDFIASVFPDYSAYIDDLTDRFYDAGKDD